MKAVVVTEYGGSAEVLDVPAPDVQAGQVLIKVLAAGMNPMDRAIAAGGWQSVMPATFPASDADAFAALAARVRDGGTALTTRYVADVDALAAKGVTALNFQLPASTALLERVADALATGRIAAPPINRISLKQAPAVFAGEGGGKTVIVP